MEILLAMAGFVANTAIVAWIVVSVIVTLGAVFCWSSLDSTNRHMEHDMEDRFNER